MMASVRQTGIVAENNYSNFMALGKMKCKKKKKKWQKPDKKTTEVAFI